MSDFINIKEERSFNMTSLKKSTSFFLFQREFYDTFIRLWYCNRDPPTYI